MGAAVRLNRLLYIIKTLLSRVLSNICTFEADFTIYPKRHRLSTIYIIFVGFYFWYIYIHCFRRNDNICKRLEFQM